MGCDIHVHAERRADGKWQKVDVHNLFGWRSYGVFGFLAGVRNYSAVTPLSTPRGLPDDASYAVQNEYDEWGLDAHSASWLSLDELRAVDYDAEVEDRRTRVQVSPNLWNGAATAEPGNGEKMRLRDFLGSAYLEEIDKLTKAGADRIVFWFDN